jgi:hypothetical protein
MENYIKNNVNDITYLSELIPPFWWFSYLNFIPKGRD